LTRHRTKVSRAKDIACRCDCIC